MLKINEIVNINHTISKDLFISGGDISKIMNTIGGKLIFPDNNDLDLPEQYREGAAIILAFKEA